MPLESTHQVDCNGCGAKLDLHAGLRSKTFVCDYCGAVNEGKQVLAVQEIQQLRERYRPWSPLKLGLTAKLLGQEYQIVGRIRCEEQDWHWDEWFLYSRTGFPLWLQEGEDGFTIYRVYYPTVPIDPWAVGSFVKLDDAGTKAIVKERGIGTIVFLEGELTWSAKPGETYQYLECVRGEQRFSVEYSEKEIQFIRGEKRGRSKIYQAFGLRSDASPDAPAAAAAGAAAAAAGSDGWDQAAAAEEGRAARQAKAARSGRKLLATVAVVAAASLLGFALCGGKTEKLVGSYTVQARHASSQDEGALLTDDRGKPVRITLPKGMGAYELRLASSGLGATGTHAGGYCWWAEVDFLKERPKADLAKVKKDDDDDEVDEWARYQVVHQVEEWFGAYWGIDEGERWSEAETVKSHYFRTKDPGPYYLRVYAHNCEDVESRVTNPLLHATMTLGIYRNVWMVRWPLGMGIALASLLGLLLYLWNRK